MNLQDTEADSVVPGGGFDYMDVADIPGSGYFLGKESRPKITMP